MKKLASALVFCCLAATACSDQPAEAPLSVTGPSFQQASGPCPSSTTIEGLIKEVFPSGGDRSSALSRFHQVVKLMGSGRRRPHTASARAHALRLIEFIVQKYDAGRLIGGHSIPTQDKLQQVLNGILCIVDLPQVFGPGSLGDDAAVAFIYPSTPDTTVVTGTEWAGVTIPAASVTEPSLVTIRRLPDFPGPLLTQLDQYPIYYEFDVSTGQPFAQDVTVGVCLADNVVVPDSSRLRLAHNVAPYTMGSIEIAPLAAAPFLDCTDAPLASSPSRWGFDLARAGGWLERRLAALLLPRPAYAFALGGVGGTVRTFSPFGVVDTLGVITPATPYPELHAPTVGTTVSPTPSVLVRTPTGRPMVGVPVDFTVTLGGGSVSGGSTATDANGQATVVSWTLGPTERRNELRVTATAPAGAGFASSGFEVPYTFLGFPRIWP
jgi:hypothetical protein